MAGSGAAHPEAKRLLRRLAETLALPVATSPKGKGVFPEGHPLALGVLGHAGHRSAREYLDGGVDVILTIGCGLRETSTNGGKLPLYASKGMIRIDIVEQSPMSFYPADLNLLGESKYVLASLLSAVGKKINPPKEFGGVLYNPIQPASAGAGLNPATVLGILARKLPRDTIWTSDIGEHLFFSLHYLQIGESSQFLADLGLGSMGTGIGAAIGAALGHPGRTVVCICGDYGFQMYGMELMTAAEQGANLICVVMNDAKMGMVVNGKEQIYGRSSPHGRIFLDIATIATSMGIPGRSVGDESEMLEALSNMPNGTSILDVDVRGQNRFGLVERVSMISSTMNEGAGAASKKGEQNGSQRRAG
jgi:acetolactate synthase-1/2/3 large subunit